MRKQSGFTLIELMVVMAIIAILATAGLTAYSSYLKKARDSARVQTARALMTKVEELANGGPTPTPAQLVAFLEAENFASTPLPTMHPLVAQVSGVVDTLLGTSFALVDIDPLSGAANCYYDYLANYNANCVFTYGIFADGTYYISYSIEHLDSVNNFWQLPYGGPNPYPTVGSNLNYLGGNVIGTNSNLVGGTTGGGSLMDNIFTYNAGHLGADRNMIGLDIISVQG